MMKVSLFNILFNIILNLLNSFVALPFSSNTLFLTFVMDASRISIKRDDNLSIYLIYKMDTWK